MWLTNDWVFYGGVALVYGAMSLLVLRLYEPRLLFYPHYPSRNLDRTPAALGLRYEEVHLKTADGLGVHGWFLPCGDAPSRLTLLFFHGNAGNISHRLEKCRVFQELGLDVLVIDYRGYGQSEGKPGEKGLYRDADAAYQYLTQQRHVSPAAIVVYGESLGTAVAVELASRLAVGGVILEAAFTSIADVSRKLFVGLPLGYLAKNRFDSLGKMGLLKSPLLLLHSRSDEMFPMGYAQRLLEAAVEPKRLVELQGGHADAFLESEAVVRREVVGFLGRLQYPKPPPAPPS